MVFRGMIFQFNGDEGTGLIMLSDGEKKEFGTNDWIDASNTPSIGMEVLYENSDNLIKIKMLSPEEKSRILLDEKSKKEDSTRGTAKSVDAELTEADPQFSSVDEYIKYFMDKGYKLASDSDDGESRNATLRMYVMGEYSEAIIKQSDSKISVIKMIDGKKVP